MPFAGKVLPSSSQSPPFLLTPTLFFTYVTCLVLEGYLCVRMCVCEILLS